jgi:hypothetical protein
MKKLEIQTTSIELRKLTGKPLDDGFMATTKDLIEVTLDIVPQGGFTPKDIRDRNRIQSVLDKLKDKKPKKEGDSLMIELEDQDYENLKTVVNSSRWVSREKDLQIFLDSFKD